MRGRSSFARSTTRCRCANRRRWTICRTRRCSARPWRAIEFIAEALHAIARIDPAGGDTAVRPQDARRTSAIYDFLEEHLDESFTLQSIAHDVGMSVNTMQRVFRATYGTMVFEHVRTRKLERACDALERDGVSVAQAAYIAGYASAANFATAFKRAFGRSPKNFRGQA